MRNASLFAALLFFAACGDDMPERASQGGGGGGLNCSAGNALQRFSTAYVAASARCNVGSKLSRGPISQAARVRFMLADVASTFGPSIAAGIVSLNVTELCAAASSLSGDSCAIDSAGWDLFDGTRPLGGECNQDEECANGWCDFDGGCPGVCTAYLAIGAPCPTDSGCPRGATCSFLTGEPTCEEQAPPVFVAAGGACDTEGATCLRSYCDGSICQPYPTLGQSCEATDICDGSFCNEATFTCGVWLDEGAECSGSRDCRDGLFCDADMSLPVCKPLLALGESCFDPGPSSSCASGICTQDGLCADAFAPVACGGL